MPWVVVDGLGDIDIAQRATEKEAQELAEKHGGKDRCFVVEYRELSGKKNCGNELFSLDGE
jgi:hypothetical protein